MDKSQVRFHSCKQRILDMMCLVVECMGLRSPVPWDYFEGFACKATCKLGCFRGSSYTWRNHLDFMYRALNPTSLDTRRPCHACILIRSGEDPPAYEVLAAGDEGVHLQVLESLDWRNRRH
jgi:hypothetical protein